MEVKFRAWDKDENEIIYDVQNTHDYHCSGQGAIEESFGSVLSDQRYIVMQYANLTDSCGTELYDGAEAGNVPEGYGTIELEL